MTLLSGVLAVVWSAGFWTLSRDTRDTVATTMTGALACMLAVGLAAADIWPQVRSGYPRDSYWALNWIGHTGVISISLVGIAMFFWVIAAKSRMILHIAPRTNRMLVAVLDIAAGQLAFAVLLSLSPQLYYSLYQLLFPDLPAQWVVKGLLDTDRLRVVAGLIPGGSMSDHLAGIVLWAVVPFTVWLHLRGWRRRQLSPN